MSAVIDASARTSAIDPFASFCVSAPAGSGKTELLIQRYLCLLSRVRRPEQILAITFTRKAAAEMRERVMMALQSARAGERCDNPHLQMTRALAEQVLLADEREDWQIFRHISRLNIKTIDSFCAVLTRQMPVLSRFGGLADVQDDVTELYQEAVLELYKLLEQDHPVAVDLAALMLHFDNNWERLQVLLVSMLARREQWRDYMGVHHAPEEAGAYLAAAVESLVRDELRELAGILLPYQGELLELLQFATVNLSESKPMVFPGLAPVELPAWRRLGNLLLTKKGLWRRSVTKRDGFPSNRGEPEERKRQMKVLLGELQLIEGLAGRLAAMQRLPDINEGNASWQLVLHLSRLLPMLAAQLLLVFQKHGVVDHSQVAQSALLALGEDDAPTELALRLDYQIEHILVDEFQDTAINQYDLLHRLTRGWGEYNAEHLQSPRTLMIVGDARQSIYGFRGANVGLFLKAQREGFNGVELRQLELQCNFRSDAGIVDWTNETFLKAFARRTEESRGPPGFNPAIAVRSCVYDSSVALHAFQGEDAREQEVAFICKEIAECIEQTGDTIAVLGRSRGHLQPIVRRLKQLNIPFNAPDLDSLDHSPVVADLLTLCKALANDADRLSWAALLRAPWCGLQLADLLVVARAGQGTEAGSIWSSVQNGHLPGLSEDGRNRLLHIVGPLSQARAKRDRLGLRVWIEQTWIELSGPQCASDINGLHDAENFFQLLEKADAEGRGLDIDWLTRSLQKRFISTGNPDSQIQLMTVHKAKGLEFDCVIIPQLDGVTGKDERELLLWDEHSSANGMRSFLLAADDHSSRDEPTLYNYLSVQRQEKAQQEAVRLLYVGVTRAVSRLLLTCRLKSFDNDGLPREPARMSLLYPIWPTFQQQMTLHESGSASETPAASLPPPPLRGLTRLVRNAECSTVHSPASNSLSRPAATHPRPDNYLERSIGSVVHVALEQLSKRSPLPSLVDEQDRKRWRWALQRAGLWGATLEEAEQAVLASVDQTLRPDGLGRWMLSADHAQAHSEWAMTTADALGCVENIIIDRSFVDRITGERWVIDYKNSCPAPGELQETFLARESANYQDKLRCYRDAVRHRFTEPLRCALFFTSLGHLHTVPELDLPGLEG